MSQLSFIARIVLCKGDLVASNVKEHCFLIGCSLDAGSGLSRLGLSVVKPSIKSHSVWDIWFLVMYG